MIMIPVNVLDYRRLAKSKLPKNIFDFIDAGACDELTKKNNREAFDTLNFRPFCLKDVSSIEPSCSLFNQILPFPLLIAPTACHQLVDKQGEISTANAAKMCNTPMIVSAMSNKSLEEIASTSLHNNLWLQIYIFKDRALTESLILRAQKAGYKAIVITVGTPIIGKRDRMIRNPLIYPKHLTAGNFHSTIGNQKIYDFAAHELDPALTWRDIEWVQSMTSLPVILKGILNPYDANKACDMNISGIVVSNHGGRQLDTSEATLCVLPDIVKTVNKRIAVLIDGGIHRGTDIFKCIALGADAVLIGRSILWALSVSGQAGVENLLRLLKDEFEMTMKLTGCVSLQEIRNFKEYILRDIRHHE